MKSTRMSLLTAACLWLAQGWAITATAAVIPTFERSARCGDRFDGEFTKPHEIHEYQVRVDRGDFLSLTATPVGDFLDLRSRVVGPAGGTVHFDRALLREVSVRTERVATGGIHRILIHNFGYDRKDGAYLQNWQGGDHNEESSRTRGAPGTYSLTIGCGRTTPPEASPTYDPAPPAAGASRAELRRQIAELQDEVRRLRDENNRLRAQLDERDGRDSPTTGGWTKPRPTTTPPPDRPTDRRGVTLYEDANYSGRSEFFAADDPSLVDNVFGHDSASSIRVDPGCTAILFRDTEYRGRNTAVSSDMPGLRDTAVGNDEASSIRVICR